MNNDFAKSILDNPYNRVEDGQKIELFNVLSKYRYQRQNRRLSNLDVYAEDVRCNKRGTFSLPELDKRRQYDWN